jgi:hypothetical protein
MCQRATNTSCLACIAPTTSPQSHLWHRCHLFVLSIMHLVLITQRPSRKAYMPHFSQRAHGSRHPEAPASRQGDTWKILYILVLGSNPRHLDIEPMLIPIVTPIIALSIRDLILLLPLRMSEGMKVHQANCASLVTPSSKMCFGRFCIS